eukprot:Gb_34100 [translate_table: standard]
MEIWSPQRRRASKSSNYSLLRTIFILLKLSFLVLGFVSFIHFARFALPSLHHCMVYTVPSLWHSFSRWLTPPYLYIILNCIILTIAATSSVHHRLNSTATEESAAYQKQQHQQQEVTQLNNYHHHQVAEIHPNSYHHETALYEVHSMVSEGTHLPSSSPTKILEDDDDDDVNFIVRSKWSPVPRQRFLRSPSSSPACSTREDSCIATADDKPLASSRFTHRKSAKASPDTKSLKIAKSKKGETLEYTWKTITEGRHPPLARHLRKSDTWDTSPRVSSELVSPARSLRMSETMRNRGGEDSPSSPSRYSLKREPSLSQDELNRRVEAFITKFNMEMRLQRQNSLTHYMEMVNRGCH